jgi:predicted naringenin-chalcone synthase
MAGTLVQGRAASQGGNPRASLLFIELCSLHFDPRRIDPQQIVMSSLFADGAIRFDVSVLKPREGFALLKYAEEIVSESEGEMTWALCDTAFAMTLSRAVPVLLRKTAPGFVGHLLESTGLEIKDIHAFAIHPGGPRIVEYVSEALNLRPEQMSHSLQILRAKGNMSSCTVPYIWNCILKDPTIPSGAYVLSLAFGPGLTIAGNILQKEV